MGRWDGTTIQLTKDCPYCRHYKAPDKCLWGVADKLLKTPDGPLRYCVKKSTPSSRERGEIPNA
jgi:hypothetical protein